MSKLSKKGARSALIICVAASILMQACSAVLPDDHIELADSFEGEGIVTAEQLLSFVENGTEDTASLLAPIDLEREMIKISAARGPVTIEGNGFSITGNGDCAIRLDDGAAVILNDISIVSSADAIGCLGDATVGGTGLDIAAAGNGVIAKGMLAILENSSMTIESIEGSGLYAKGITLNTGASVTATAGLNAVHTTKNDLVLYEGAKLHAYTSENYNAVKCADTLVMENGSVFTAENSGDYHGAEVDMISVSGVVTVQCKGGSKGMGMFVFTQTEDICVLGYCTPKAQFENGSGSITFAADMTEYASWLEEKQAAEAAAAAAQQSNDDTTEGETEGEG